MRIGRSLLAATLVLTMLATPAAGLCTFYTDPKFPTLVPEVLEANITIQIKDGYASVEIKKTFYNPDPNTNQVGDIIFPLPSEAAFITALQMSVDDQWQNATVVDRDEGRRNFSKAVDEDRDASLLEHLGGTQYALRVTLPAQEERILLVRYEEALTRQDGRFSYRYPLTEEALSDPAVLSLTLDASTTGGFIHFEPDGPDGMTVSRPADSAAVIEFVTTQGAAALDTDLTLEWETEGAAEAQLFVERMTNASNHFVFRLIPGQETVRASPPLAQDVVVLADLSGSMGKDDGLAKLRVAVDEAVAALDAEDRVIVAQLRGNTTAWNDGFLPGGAEARVAATRFLAEAEAQGSTNLELGLETALTLLDDGRPAAQPVIVLVSDGQVTNGISGTPLMHLLGAVNRGTGRDAVIHTVQVGDAKEQALKFDPWGRRIDGAVPELVSVAGTNSGRTIAVAEPEILGLTLRETSRVLLKDVMIEVTGGNASNVAPSRAEHVFVGGELMVAGNYDTEGDLTVTVRGQNDGALAVLEWTFDTSEATEYDLADRIGALLRLRHLLDSIRVQGERAEWVDEVKALAADYGFVTPYTSLLVDQQSASDEASTSAGAGAPARAAAAPPGGPAFDTYRIYPSGRSPQEIRTAIMESAFVRDREFDRLVVHDSPGFQALDQSMARWIVFAGDEQGILLVDHQIVVVADWLTIAQIQGIASESPQDTPSPLLVMPTLFVLVAVVLLRRRLA